MISRQKKIIERIRKVFGDSFILPDPERETVDFRFQIYVICPIHGKFKAFAGSMIHQKSGCRHCAQLKRQLSRKLGKDAAVIRMNGFYMYINGLSKKSPLSKIIKRNYDVPFPSFEDLKTLYEVYDETHVSGIETEPGEANVDSIR